MTLERKIELAYQEMVQAGYKPILTQRIVGDPNRYLEQFKKEEPDKVYIGTASFDTVSAVVFTLEAARCMCRTSDVGNAPKLLYMALKAMGVEHPHENWNGHRP